MRTRISFLLTFLSIPAISQTKISIHDEYKGHGEGEISLSLIMLNPDDGTAAARVSTAAPGCYGELAGAGRVKDHVLVISPYKKEDGGTNCAISVNFTTNGSGATVSESQCAYYHGAACAFDGSLIQTDTKPSPKFAPPTRESQNISDTPDSGELILSQVDTVGSSAQVTVAKELNKDIVDLRIYKDTDKSRIDLYFMLKYPWCPSCRFLIRIFDKNGVYIAHFTSEENVKLFGVEGMLSRDTKKVHLTYQVSAKDLEFAKSAELGFLVL